MTGAHLPVLVTLIPIPRDWRKALPLGLLAGCFYGTLVSKSATRVFVTFIYSHFFSPALGGGCMPSWPARRTMSVYPPSQ